MQEIRKSDVFFVDARNFYSDRPSTLSTKPHDSSLFTHQVTMALSLHTTSSSRESKKRQKRERLLQVSLRLFRENGFEQTKVIDITREAGVAKGTFFNYFPTKESVLLALGEQMLGKLGQIDTANVFQQKTARNKVKAMFHVLAAGLDSDRDLVKEMIYRGLRLSDLVDNSRAQLDFRAMLSLLIEQGKRKGEVIEEADAYFVADALYTLYFQQIVVWCSKDFQTSLPEQLDRTVDMIFDGISRC